MDGGGRLGRRLSFVDSGATEEEEAEETGKNNKGRSGGLFQCTATTITLKDRHGRCSVRGSQRVRIPRSSDAVLLCQPSLLSSLITDRLLQRLGF